MFWNYRIVNLKSENGGEDWYCIREVYYDENNKPEGHSDIAVGSESLEDLSNVLHMMGEALKLPVLQEGDFPVEEEDLPFDKRGFNDFTKFMEYVTNNPLKPLKPF